MRNQGKKKGGLYLSQSSTFTHMIEYEGANTYEIWKVTESLVFILNIIHQSHTDNTVMV
jgi:hypothetical protein